MKRTLKIAVVILPLLLIAAWIGLRLFLHSTRVASQVTSQITAAYGGPVAIKTVDIGLKGTTLSGLQFFEPGADASKAAPWLTIDALTADLPLWDLVRGDTTPTQVDLAGVHVLLRFDEDGNLATQLPEQQSLDHEALPWDRMPRVSIEKGELVFRKAGQGDLNAKNISARIVKEAERLVLTGTSDSDIGKLKLSGGLEKGSQIATTRIATTATGHVTQEMLDRLPFVPRTILQEFRIPSGDTSGDLTLTYDLHKKAFHYRADLDTKNTKLHLPSMDVTVHNGHGKVIIDDYLVNLRGVQGEAFGGTVYADGKMDFSGGLTRVALTEAKVENLDAKSVPDSWGIPLVVRKSIANGKLFGKVKLDLTMGESGATPEMAAAVIASAVPNLATEPWLNPVVIVAATPHNRIRINTRGKGEVRDPTGKVEPIQFDWQGATPASPTANKAAKGPTLEDLRAMLTTLVTVEADFNDQEAQPKPAGTPNYFDFKFNLKNASLAEIIKNEGVKLPFPVDAKISFQVKASIPVNTLSELKAYKADGSAQVQNLNIAGVKIDELTTDFQFKDGTLYLTALKGAIADKAGKPGAAGALSGSAQVQIEPLGDLRADLTFDKIDLAKVSGQPPDQVQGAISGNLAIRGRADQLPDAKALKADGKIASDRLSVFGFVVEQFATSVKLKDGVLALPDMQARVNGELITPSASVQLTENQSFQARFSFRDLDTASLRKVAESKKISIPPVSGTVSADTVVKGQLSPFQAAISGDLQAKTLKLDNVATDDVRVHWELDKNQLKATDLNASLYEGKATGSAVFPTDGKSAGKLDLQIKDINVKRLAKDLRMPISMEGRVAGAFKGTFTPADEKEDAKAIFNVDFTAPKLRVQNIPTEQLKGKLEYQHGAIDYTLTGKTLGGTFDLEGQIPGDGKPAKQKEIKGKQGRLRINNVLIGRLLEALGAGAADLRGALNLDVQYTHDPKDHLPRGSGTLRISGLRWRDRAITDNIQGDVVLADQQIRIRNLGGEIAQGTIAAQLAYYLREPERSWFSLNLDAVETKVLLAPWFDGKVEGPIHARIRGRRLGGAWTGMADFDMARGKIYGLDIAQWRLPVNFSYAPEQNSGQIDIHETAAQLVHGRATGKLSMTWQHSARVDGFLRMDRVELRELLKETIGASDIGAGRTTAKFDFKGNEVRSLNDLSGTLVAAFEDTQALQTPVLKQITPYLGLGPSTTFQKGNLVARLGSGTLRIQQMALQGANVQVFVDGTMTLQEQLNLHVIAKTGDVGWPTLRLGPIGLRVPLAGPVPLLVLQEASNLLSNHVVYLDITGTPRSPVIRPRPLAILSEEAVRFFLNRANLPITLNP